MALRCAVVRSRNGTSNGIPLARAYRRKSMASCLYRGFVHGSIAPSASDLPLSGIDAVQIEIDGVAESLAARTRAVGIVEREKPRFGLLIHGAAFLAVESFVEDESIGRLGRRTGWIVRHKFAEWLRRGLRDSRSRSSPPGASGFRATSASRSTSTYTGFAKSTVEQVFRRRELEHAPCLVEPVKSALAQVRERQSYRVR